MTVETAPDGATGASGSDELVSDELVSDEPVGGDRVGPPPGAAERSERGRADACRSAAVCDRLNGDGTVVLDLTAVTPVFDYFVISTGTNRRQMAAIAEKVDRTLREHGVRPLGREGDDAGGWILHDFGDVVLHVFTPEARELYDLEGLWADAVTVDWRAEVDGPPDPPPAVAAAGDTGTDEG